jgi:hypothetical protein
MPAPSLALAQLLQSCASKRFVVVALGHHVPARAYASPFLHKQDAAEKIGLHVKPIEAAHFARRADAPKMHSVHGVSLEIVLCETL